jgi:hypothetical protein
MPYLRKESPMEVFGYMVGAEAHHRDYESYVQYRTNNLYTSFDPCIMFDGSLDGVTAYNATIRIVNDTTFDTDEGCGCVWMDTHCD